MADQYWEDYFDGVYAAHFADAEFDRAEFDRAEFDGWGNGNIHQPRKIEPSIERWYQVLGTALEHASHGWYALERECLAERFIKVERVNSFAWPPNVTNKVGSAPYHLAAMMSYIHEVFNSISDAREQPYNNVFNRTPRARATSFIGSSLAWAGNWLIKLSERAG